MNKIIIVVEGGVIQNILNIPPGSKVIIRDCDTDDSGPEEDREEYIETEWSGPFEQEKE